MANGFLDTISSWLKAPEPATPRTPPVRAALPPLGTVLLDRYRLDAGLGHGAAATVFAATDLVLQQPIAVKIATPGGIGSGAQARRDGVDLVHEAQITMRLSHPNVVRVSGYERVGNLEILLMERLAGTDLSALRARRGRLSPEETAVIGVQLLAALTHVHGRGVVHNDVKPGNVLYDGTVAKLIDFGSAVDGRPVPGVVAGSLAYMAPERLRNEAPSPRSDLYSVACTLFTLVTGAPPFGRSDLTALRGHLREAPPDVPGPLGAVIRIGLAKEPSERFRDAGHMLGALERAARLTRMGTETCGECIA